MCPTQTPNIGSRSRARGENTRRILKPSTVGLFGQNGDRQTLTTFSTVVYPTSRWTGGCFGYTLTPALFVASSSASSQVGQCRYPSDLVRQIGTMSIQFLADRTNGHAYATV